MPFCTNSSFSTNARWQGRPSYERTPTSSSTDSGVRFSGTVRFASAAAELCHSEALFPEDCSFPSRSRHYLWTPTLVWRPSFVELLDPVKGRHALLLDVQRVDPRRCFPLRISRQESAVSRISSSHTSHLNRGHIYV